jgi:hypothetical protein
MGRREYHGTPKRPAAEFSTVAAVFHRGTGSVPLNPIDPVELTVDIRYWINLNDFR